MPSKHSTVTAVRDATRALKSAVKTLIEESEPEHTEHLFDEVFTGSMNQRAALLQIFNGTTALLAIELRAAQRCSSAQRITNAN